MSSDGINKAESLVNVALYYFAALRIDEREHSIKSLVQLEACNSELQQRLESDYRHMEDADDALWKHLASEGVVAKCRQCRKQRERSTPPVICWRLTYKGESELVKVMASLTTTTTTTATTTTTTTCMSVSGGSTNSRQDTSSSSSSSKKGE